MKSLARTVAIVLSLVAISFVATGTAEAKKGHAGHKGSHRVGNPAPHNKGGTLTGGTNG